jgi:hypothetical protein
MTSQKDHQSRSEGFWYRRGNTLVILPTDQLASSRIERAEDSHREISTDYTQCDLIDSRIDVAAQRALYQMLKRGLTSRRDALAILAAVKAGRLRGVFREDQKVPAVRARALGKGWWQLVPSGQRAACVTQPEGQPPLIAFKRGLTSNVVELGAALQNAWAQCGLPVLTAPPPSGKPCASVPPPPPPPPPPKPSNGDQPKPSIQGCGWEANIDWDEKFERHFQSCCTSLSAARSFCPLVPEWAQLLPQFEICRLAFAELEARVDQCIFQNVHAEVVQETGIVASLGACSPAAVTGRRFAAWKSRTGRKCA